MPTTSGDIQQKNRQPIFGDVETRLKMTFHLPQENPRATRRLCKPLSKTPPLFFHYENAFRKKGKTISIQTHPNLIISQRRASRMSKLQNLSNPKTTSNPKQAINRMPHLGVPDRQNLRFQQKFFTATDKSQTNRFKKILHRSLSSISVPSVFRQWLNSLRCRGIRPLWPQSPMPLSFTSHVSAAPIHPATATHSAYQPSIKNPQPKNSLVTRNRPAKKFLRPHSPQTNSAIAPPCPRSPASCSLILKPYSPPS